MVFSCGSGQDVHAYIDVWVGMCTFVVVVVVVVTAVVVFVPRVVHLCERK